MGNMDLWNKVSRPPKEALKTIGAGRLKGKTDINPQWRYQALTEAFGVCGIGWKYTIERLWLDPAPDGQSMCNAAICLYVRNGDEWSDPIPGIGGSMAIKDESAGLHANDEAYKMAVTDALSVACKMLGIAADIYAGRWDGSKYAGAPDPGPALISEKQAADLRAMMGEVGADEKRFLSYLKVKALKDLPASQFKMAVAALESKRRASK